MTKSAVGCLPLVLLTLAAACGGSAPPPRAKAAPVRLEDVAMGGVEEQLSELGYRLHAERGAANVAASRAGADWSFSLGVASEATDRGPKLQVRLSVFREPGHTLRGDLAPWAIFSGDAPSDSARRSLVRDLGKRAARQFAEQFGSP